MTASAAWRPHNWPAHVPPPGVAHWQRHATNWLLERCPADYRSHQILTQHPLALAHLARLHVVAQLSASNTARATIRVRLADHLAPAAVDATLAAIAHEQHHLNQALDSIDAIGMAIRQHSGTDD